MRVKCLVQEHNTMSPSKARTADRSLLESGAIPINIRPYVHNNVFIQFTISALFQNTLIYCENNWQVFTIHDVFTFHDSTPVINCEGKEGFKT